MRVKMCRQPRARCLKLFLFLTGSTMIILWNYENPQGLSGQGSKHITKGNSVMPVAPQPKRHQFTPGPLPNKPVETAPPKSADTEATPAPKVKAALESKPGKIKGKAQKTGLVAGEGSFYMDGSAIRLLGGSFHYFRTHPAQWEDRLRKMKAAGLNTVTTYIPWNLHEPQKGRYEFDGFFSITKFIQQVQKENLYLIVRPGPYICAEWEFGGFPYWLLRDPNMQLRTSKYQPYLKTVEIYMNKLLPLFVPYMYKNGGPIIAFQIENEFGSWRPKGDAAYMKFLHELFIKNGLNKELLFTSDGAPHLRKGQIPGVLTTVNFNTEPAKKLGALKKLQPHKPLMVMEFWPGWFDRVGEGHHRMVVDELQSKVHTVLAMNASINFYMFVGGTHFDFWNGASNLSSEYTPLTTSYDYDAPISESGDLTPKYQMLKKLFADFKLVPKDLPEAPKDAPKEAYGVVKMGESVRYDQLISLIPSPILSYKYPRTMENIDVNHGSGQGYGWILYRTKIKKSQVPLIMEKPVHDRASVIVNSKHVDTLGWKSGMHPVKLPGDMKPTQNILDVFVENMGRVNWQHPMNTERKGLTGNVTLGKGILTNWKHISFQFCELFKHNLTATKLWKPYSVGSKQFSPTAYRGYLDIKTTPKDSFLNVEKWERGLVLINGFNLGRYWKGGPQRTLYVPAPVLRKGSNEVIVFELHSSPGSVDFQDKPLLSLESQKDKFDKN